MSVPPNPQLSPRQAECLRLVWERQATSKEIAGELGLSKATVDGFIAEAVQRLGARDRREAARIAFGGPRAESGGDAARVPMPGRSGMEGGSSVPTPATRPWRSPSQPRNTLTLAQTLIWIAAIAIGSLVALTLAMIIGNGVPPVAHSALQAAHRLIR